MISTYAILLLAIWALGYVLNRLMPVRTINFFRTTTMFLITGAILYGGGFFDVMHWQQVVYFGLGGLCLLVMAVLHGQEYTIKPEDVITDLFGIGVAWLFYYSAGFFDFIVQ